MIEEPYGGIRMKYDDEEGLHVPFFACTTCNQPIEDLEEGIAAWGWGETPLVVFFHKGRCDPTYAWGLRDSDKDGAIQGFGDWADAFAPRPLWGPISHLLRWLVNNHPENRLHP